MTAAPILAVVETYYDAAPRPSARTEEVGPFTLFVRADPDGWPFYARPRLGLVESVTTPDVSRARDRLRVLGAPEAFEWVAETAPSLSEAAPDAGLAVTRCQLLVLPTEGSILPRHAADLREEVTPRARRGMRARVLVRMLGPDDPDLPRALGAVHAGFGSSDDVEPRDPGSRTALMSAGLLAVAAAYDERGDVVGGGSHSPRGTTTELTGIAVLPRARRRGVGEALTAALVADARDRGVETVFLSAATDEVARVYGRVGFVRVGTACSAEPTS